jgi:predicted PurR-regulated permease PerM
VRFYKNLWQGFSVRFSQWLSLVILGVCLYIIWQIRNVLLLALTAIVFAVVLNRGAERLQRRIPDRRASVLVLLSSVLVVLGILGIIIVPPFINQLQDLIGFAPQIIDRIQNWVDSLGNIVPGLSIQDYQSVDSILSQLRSIDLEMIFGRFFKWFSNTLTVTLNLLLVTVLTIMLLLNPKAYRKLFLRTFPASNRQQVERVLDNCEDAIAGWFIGILFNMTVIALMSMTGLWILGIPLAFANGLLAGLLAFIPNIGPVVSVVPPAAIALLEAPWKALAVIILYVVIQQIESNVLTPLVMKRQVSLLPAVTLLSQVIFAIFFGFLGLLLALPLVLIIQQWLEEFWVKGFLDAR